MEWGERDLCIADVHRRVVQHHQLHNSGKCLDQTNLSCIRDRDDFRVTDQQCVCVIRRGSRTILERLLPQLEVDWGTEADIGEKVLACPWNP